MANRHKCTCSPEKIALIWQLALVGGASFTRRPKPPEKVASILKFENDINAKSARVEVEVQFRTSILNNKVTTHT